MPKLSQTEFTRTIRSFSQSESMRAQLYFSALDLIKAGFVIEAHILILATWNFARFRYVTRTFDLAGYRKIVGSISKQLHPLVGHTSMKTDLAAHKKIIADAFDTLAAIKGIEFTGATKILHLLNPEMFVMWDRFISGQYAKKRYRKLDIVKRGFWKFRKFPCSGIGYFAFLYQCQKTFRHLVSPDSRKTLAKCIDEFNFCKITIPLDSAVEAAP